MLISPDSYDNQKLWCNSQLYPTILSAEIISFTRDAPSYFTLMKFLTDPALSVSIFFFLLVYRSLFPVWLYGREGWVLYTYCRGVCIPAGLSILFLLSPPPAPVSNCAARTLPLASHLPPLFYPSSGHPAYSRTSHCSSQEMVPGGLLQPTTMPNHDPSVHDDLQATLSSWMAGVLLLHCLFIWHA